MWNTYCLASGETRETREPFKCSAFKLLQLLNYSHTHTRTQEGNSISSMWCTHLCFPSLIHIQFCKVLIFEHAHKKISFIRIVIRENYKRNKRKRVECAFWGSPRWAMIGGSRRMLWGLATSWINIKLVKFWGARTAHTAQRILRPASKGKTGRSRRRRYIICPAYCTQHTEYYSIWHILYLWNNTRWGALMQFSSLRWKSELFGLVRLSSTRSAQDLASRSSYSFSFFFYLFFFVFFLRAALRYTCTGKTGPDALSSSQCIYSGLSFSLSYTYTLGATR